MPGDDAAVPALPNHSSNPGEPLLRHSKGGEKTGSKLQSRSCSKEESVQEDKEADSPLQKN